MAQEPAEGLADTEIESGFRIRDSKLDILKPVFRSYANVIEAYAGRFSKHDGPYFYNERANISMLAAATWLSGNVAIEEYSCVKGESERSRADIFLHMYTKSFQVEAKLEWIDADGKASTAAKQITRKLEAAVRDVEKIDKAESHHQLGCLFAIPRFKKKPRVEDLRGFLESTFSLEFDAVTWCFSNTYRGLRAGEKFYPGVAIFLKHAHLPA